MNYKERMRSLSKEAQGLENEKRVLLEALESAADPDNFQTSLNDIDDPRLILQQAHDRIRRVLDFKIITFYLVNEEDSDFYQAFTEPVTAAETIAREVNALIDDRTFAWALRRNKPLIVSSINKREKIILHSLNTPWRARGILVGILASPEKKITDISLFLFSITIINCSNALESFELYRRIKDKNIELQKNITMLKESGKKLAEEEEKYRALFEQSTNSIILYDPETRMPVQFNHLACENLGYTHEEFRDLKMEDYSLTTLEEIKNWLYYAIKHGRHFFETRLRRKNGEIRDITVNVRSIHIGDQTYLLTLLDDITEKKRAEAERLLLEKQLHQAQKMESLGTLAGGIAHDFYNILGVILGYGELSLTELPDEPGDSLSLRQNIENLLKAVIRAKELVQQILTFSRQGDGKHKPLNVNAIAKETLKLLRSTLPTNIEINQTIGKEINMVMGTPTQIQQVIMNLCTNSLHAMGANHGILSLDVRKVDIGKELIKGNIVICEKMEPGPYVQVTVSDTGHGISPAIMERVFDPFFTTKPPGQGSGLGLSVVHGIVKSLNGNIAIESQLDQGTTIRVWFPIIDSIEEPERKEFETIPFGTENILLVDDEEELLKSHHQILKQLHYNVISTASSTQALAIFRQNPEAFNIIITDMSMPTMTGTQLAMEALTIRPDIPIILSTGFSEFIDAKQAKAIGIKEFLMKPVDKQTLATVIRNVLDENHAAPEPHL